LGCSGSSQQLLTLKKHICLVPAARATFVKSVELRANFKMLRILEIGSKSSLLLFARASLTGKSAGSQARSPAS
jgi:hypothetical protein